MATKLDIHQTCEIARAKFKKYSGGPEPADLFYEPRWTMSNAHLSFVDGFENIYNLAEKIPPSEEQDFAFYCYCCVKVLHHHHTIEEEVFFEGLRPEMDIDVATDHDTFMAGLQELEKYLVDVLGMKTAPKDEQPVSSNSMVNKAPYDGKKIKRFVDDMYEPLFDHLMREIDWLAPDAFVSNGITPERLKGINKRMMERIMASIDMWTDLVWGLGHHAPGSDFPPMPWFLKKVLVPWVFYWKHRKAWKYLPKYD